jgi:hypothetical protein
MPNTEFVYATLMVTPDEASVLNQILEYTYDNTSDLNYIKAAILRGEI